MSSIATELQAIDIAPTKGEKSARQAGTILLLAVIAGCVFFARLGAAPLNDWDEAWHAQVSSEILSTGEWATLHCRGEFYFNKPPLTFWLRALAFQVGGINETTARFFPALFGWGSVIASGWFFGRIFGRWTGLTAGLILSSSWLFTFYHAGRSAEADSTLLFFWVLTVIALWQARFSPRWFYVAGFCTALGWMTKGSAAYLPWMACLLAAALERPRTRWRWRHAAGGFGAAVLLTIPWQALMLMRHGHAFAHAFYFSEGALPALNAVEDHPGSPLFYGMILHQYFEPWLLLAGAAALTKLFTRRSAFSAPTLWLVAWTTVVLAACSLFATKMIWYIAPCLPALAGLAAFAAVDLCRRQWGWLALVGVAVFGVWQSRVQHWAALDQCLAGALMVAAFATCMFAPRARCPWHCVIGGLMLAVPVAQHFNLIYRTIIRDEEVTGEIELRNTDEPWRELTARLKSVPAHSELVLIDFPSPLEPASYFYLNRMQPPPHVVLIDSKALSTDPRIPGKALVIARIELVDLLKSAGLSVVLREESLVVFRKAEASVADRPSPSLTPATTAGTLPLR